VTATTAEARAEFAQYGVVHLNVVARDASMRFWRDVVGLHVRHEATGVVELGTDAATLLVLHPGATSGVRRGHTGLYHLAIYVPGEAEFARLVTRLVARRQRFGATDHVMAQSLYLSDPDGIGVELALATPERFGSVRVTAGGIEVVDAQGRIRTGQDPLDPVQLLSALRGVDRDLDRPLPAATQLGHLHLSVRNLEQAIAFYRDGLGFLLQNYWPHLGMADFHAGHGPLHRLAVNTWAGPDAPPSPPGSAGLESVTLRYNSAERLAAVLRRLPGIEQTSRGLRALDPDGNAILLSTQE